MIVMLPAVGNAQDATMSGTATDSTGGVMPGVTVTATNVDARLQHRPAADAAAADQRPELAGPHPAGAWRPPERGGRARAESPRLRADQGRWPGGDGELPLDT